MGAKESNRLFKDRITLTDYGSLIKNLSDALDGGPRTLTRLLFGTETPDLYTDHGAYRPGLHNRCAGLGSGRFTEIRLCKCMYYRSSPYPRQCGNCAFPARFDLVGAYRVTDYQVPAYYYSGGVGKIDLIVSHGSTHYATEVKPYRGNTETLLRMIAEILTYTQGYPAGKYERAIAFFEKDPETGEKTAQQAEYENADPALLALLEKAHISVFQFLEADEKAYQLCKLPSTGEPTK